MKKFSRARIIATGVLVWLVILGCRMTDLVARVNPTATATVTRTAPRPTFTAAPPTAPIVDLPPPTIPLPPPPPPTARPPTARPAPPRPPVVARPPTPVPAPPTPDLYAGFYYRPVFKGCASSANTRIEGTVYDSGAKKNGVTVRLSESDQGPKFPELADFVTGTDPSDYKHECPACQGMYRISPAEGQRVDGNWWVFVIDSGGNPLSKGFFVHTQDGPGCNTATIDFVH